MSGQSESDVLEPPARSLLAHALSRAGAAVKTPARLSSIYGIEPYESPAAFLDLLIAAVSDERSATIRCRFWPSLGARGVPPTTHSAVGGRPVSDRALGEHERGLPVLQAPSHPATRAIRRPAIVFEQMTRLDAVRAFHTASSITPVEIASLGGCGSPDARALLLVHRTPDRVLRSAREAEGLTLLASAAGLCSDDVFAEHLLEARPGAERSPIGVLSFRWAVLESRGRPKSIWRGCFGVRTGRHEPVVGARALAYTFLS